MFFCWIAGAMEGKEELGEIHNERVAGNLQSSPVRVFWASFFLHVEKSYQSTSPMS